MSNDNEIIQTIRIDPSIDCYRTFFDHEWSRQICTIAQQTKLAKAVDSLCLQWKAAANTHFMPWLMMSSVRDFWVGFLRGQETVSMTEQIIIALQQKISARMDGSLTESQHRELAQAIDDLGRAVKSRSEQAVEEIDISHLWQEFLDTPGKIELGLSVWGSQRICYGSMYHAYEDFLRHSVGLARGESDYRVFRFKDLVKDARGVFGDSITDFCLKDQFVEVARLVRNALAHNGGRVTDEFQKLPHTIVIEDGVLQIMPKNNWNLFDGLKTRALKLTEKTASLPCLQLK